MKSYSKFYKYLTVLIVAIFFGSISHGAEFIVEEGKANAEIIVSAKPTRSSNLAASDFQTLVKKITGAELKIINEPTATDNVKVFIGQSKFTDDAGVTAEGLYAGGYRIKGDGKKVYLLGDDLDFTPKGPSNLLGNHKAARKKALEEWDKLTDYAGWGIPGGLRLYKTYNRELDIWNQDQIGTLNAVNEFLRSLGVRWYMPSDLGEILPDIKSIQVPEGDKKVNPDFKMRRFYGSYRVTSKTYCRWSLRLGISWAGISGNTSGHGIAVITGRDEFKKKYPEAYALYNGKRALDRNHVCLSSEDLFRESVAYSRKVFDIYDYETTSIMPNDAYTGICQCEKCKGKDTPERGYRGRLSDHVWDFVNRVAIEVEKTHPKKTINCLAYGTYYLPALKINKLNKNVLVGIVGGRRPSAIAPEEREAIKKLRADWLKITSNKIFIFENYPALSRGEYRPLYGPHFIAESINNVRDVSIGEDIWYTGGRSPVYDGGWGMHSPGFYHLYLYTTARYYWDGSRSVDPMLNEYYRLFYGPAEKQMKEFIEYCELNWPDMYKDAEKIGKAFELFKKAEAVVDANSAYGKRIALVADYLEPLANRRVKILKNQNRAKVERFRLMGFKSDKDIVLDGKNDEKLWQWWKFGRALKENQTGRKPMLLTTFEGANNGRGHYYYIKCYDIPGRKFKSLGKENDDPEILKGDNITILIETDSHSYYQITFNPDGLIYDLEHKGGEEVVRWDSMAEIAIHKGDGFWSAEIRMPFLEDNDDPLHMITGRPPQPHTPWYFNMCRKWVGDKKTELSAYSPTGTASFHDDLKFAKTYSGRDAARVKASKK